MSIIAREAEQTKNAFENTGIKIKINKRFIIIEAKNIWWVRLDIEIFLKCSSQPIA
jgi:hypothetical protein